MKENKIIELANWRKETPAPPTYNPNRHWKELFGLGTLACISGGLPILIVSGLMTGSHPEAFFGVIAGTGLILASVPGIFYFGTEAIAEIDALIRR